jgi:hypothetical protein
MDLFFLYLLNLLLTLGMFVVLIFRAWIELRNYRIMWKQVEWRKTFEVAGRILKAERNLFTKAEGGAELYNILCKMFDVEQLESDYLARNT